MSPNVFTGLLVAQTDQRLLALARAGHERAFEIVVHRHRRPLLRYCRGMGLSDSRAEDVMQQALLRSWLALQRGCEVREPKAWLYRTVHNTAVNAIRSSREDHRPLEDGGGKQTAALAESEFERRMAVRDTLEDVAELPKLQRQAIMLTALDGRSHAEVAHALGVTNGAVRGLLYRARSTLRGAAAAIVPAPLIAWLGGVAGKLAPAANKLAEMPAAGGGPDMGGMLIKGAVVAASAAVLAAGATIGPLRPHRSSHGKPAPSHGAIATAAPVTQILGVTAAAVSDVSSTTVSASSQVAGTRLGEPGTRALHRSSRQAPVNSSEHGGQSAEADASAEAVHSGEGGEAGSGSHANGVLSQGDHGSSTGLRAPLSGTDGGSGEASSGDRSHGGGSTPEGSSSGDGGSSSPAAPEAATAPTGAEPSAVVTRQGGGDTATSADSGREPTLSN